MNRRQISSHEECAIITQYLINRQPGTGTLDSYAIALARSSVVSSDEENRLSAICFRRPVVLPFVDAYLAHRNREHLIRRKIFIVVALLETDIESNRFFLPARNSRIKLLGIAMRTVGSFIKREIGRLLILVL